MPGKDGFSHEHAISWGVLQKVGRFRPPLIDPCLLSMIPVHDPSGDLGQQIDSLTQAQYVDTHDNSPAN